MPDEEIDENSDDVVIDHDLEDITDDSDVLEKLGIDPDEAQYAPDPEQEYGDEGREVLDGGSMPSHPVGGWWAERKIYDRAAYRSRDST